MHDCISVCVCVLAPLTHRPHIELLTFNEAGVFPADAGFVRLRGDEYASKKVPRLANFLHNVKCRSPSESHSKMNPPELEQVIAIAALFVLQLQPSPELVLRLQDHTSKIGRRRRGTSVKTERQMVLFLLIPLRVCGAQANRFLAVQPVLGEKRCPMACHREYPTHPAAPPAIISKLGDVLHSTIKAPAWHLVHESPFPTRVILKQSEIRHLSWCSA